MPDENPYKPPQAVGERRTISTPWLAVRLRLLGWGTFVYGAIFLPTPLIWYFGGNQQWAFVSVYFFTIVLWIFAIRDHMRAKRGR